MAMNRQALVRKQEVAKCAPTPPLTAADSTHTEVPSPAMLLQDRIGAALATSNNAYAFEPVVEKWPAATRLAVLFVGAAASWLLVWQMLAFLI